MFRRAVASSASVPKRLPSSLPSNSNTHIATFSVLLQDAVSNADAMNIEELWKAFMAISQEELSSIPTDDLLLLAQFFVAEEDGRVGNGDKKEEIVRLRKRIEEILPELRRRTPFQDEDERIQYSSLEVIAQALHGDVHDAVDAFPSFPIPTKRRLFDNTEQWAYHTFRHVFMSLCTFASPSQALSFYADHEQTILPMVARRRRFLPILANLLKTVKDPTQLLASQHARRGLEISKKLGRAMLVAFCNAKLPNDALAVSAWLSENRISQSYGHRHALIHCLVDAEMFEKANELFISAEPQASESKGEFTSYNRAGLRLFAHQGDVEGAKRCFERFPAPRAADVTVMMHAYASQGDTENVLKLFSRFFSKRPESDSKGFMKPSVQHFSAVINALVGRNDIKGANEWLKRMIEQGIEPDIAVYNTILKGLCQRGEVTSMEVFMDQMRQAGHPPNLHSYTTLLKILARRRDVLAAEALFKRMLRENIFPDRVAVTTLMNAHVEAGSWKGVIRVFDYLQASPVKDHVLGIEVFNTLLKAYVLIGSPLEVVLKMSRRLELSGMKPTNRTFALLVQAACQSGRIDVATRLLEEMELRVESSTSNIRVTVEVLTIIMNAYFRIGERLKAREVYDDMIARGLQPSAHTFASILTSYTSASFPENVATAQEFVDTLTSSKKLNHVSERQQSGRDSSLAMIYSPLLNAYARAGDVETIKKVCADLTAKGEEPSVNVLGYVLDAYRHAGDIEGVQRLWPEIVNLAIKSTEDIDALLDPQDTSSVFYRSRRRSDLLCISLSIYIDALSRAGKHIEIAHAWNHLREQGFQFDAHNWNHLVVALVRAGEPVRAFEVVEKVIIPYSEQSRHIMRSRPEHVTSPLLFDDEEAQEEIEDEPYTVPVPRSHRKREILVDLIRKRFDGMGEEEDYAHDLQVLQQISPEWSVWKIHEATYDVLSSALDRLESGLSISPVPTAPGSTSAGTARGDDELGLEGDVESDVSTKPRDYDAESEAARETFLYIISNYRQTVGRLERWLRAKSRECSNVDGRGRGGRT